MRRSRIEDVLDVLNEMRYWFFRSGGSAGVEQLWHKAVKSVAKRELQSGRFKNQESAEKSIRDACTRRLKGVGVDDFKRIVAGWLNGTSADLRRAVATEIRSDREILLTANFFGILPSTKVANSLPTRF